jgi:hypothetical protein
MTTDEFCEECENGTDMPCKQCWDEDIERALGITVSTAIPMISSWI